MTQLELFQNYWWFLISLLGAALVFMLFVQGGQSMIFERSSEQDRQLIINSLGRKWELGFTSLVVFGGAFFASFPLYYSTSFGGAYWLWMAILLSFVVQAVSYEFRRKKGNLYGRSTYDLLLLFNGVAGCILLGVAVGMMFFGAPFTVEKVSLAAGGNPVISRWAPSHGLDVMCDWRCLLLGVAVFFLARTSAALYFLNNISAGASFEDRMRKAALGNGAAFAVLFVAFCIVLLTSTGVRCIAPGRFEREAFLYLHNLTGMWGWGVVFLLGVVAVLWGIATGIWGKARMGIWYAGPGIILTVAALFAIAAYGNTSYLPSTLDLASSLTLADSSSSLFTLKVMSWVSLLIPVVVAYIWAVWRKMNAKPLSASDIAPGKHQY